jgi:hypothetical protein
MAQSLARQIGRGHALVVTLPETLKNQYGVVPRQLERKTKRCRWVKVGQPFYPEN